MGLESRPLVRRELIVQIKEDSGAITVASRQIAAPHLALP
jgi:hypothetical protein